MHVRVDQAVLVQDELTQTLGFIHVALAQAVGKQTPRRFPLECAAQRDAFVARRAEPQGKGLWRLDPAANLHQHTLE